MFPLSFIARFGLLLLILVLLPAIAPAEEIVVLRSAPLRPYDQAIAGFNKTIAALPPPPGIKTIAPYTISQIDLKGPEAVSAPLEQLALLKPDLIVAVGTEAVERVRGGTLPVVSLLARCAEKDSSKAVPFWQIPLLVSPAHQLAAIKKTLPDVHRVGILYNPGQSAGLIDEFHRAAEQETLTLESVPIKNPQEVDGGLKALAAKKIEALLLIPDKMVITPATLDLLAYFSLEKRIPFIGFAEKYLDRGAAAAIYTTPESMGEAAGQVASRLLHGQLTPAEFEHLLPEAQIQINTRIARRLGLKYTLANDVRKDK